MIQRIQTIFLALVAISCILLFFFPLANYYDVVNGNYKFFIQGVKYMDPEPQVRFGTLFALPLIIMVAASFIFSVGTLFLYKNRPLQIRLITFNVLLNIILLIVIFFFYATKIKTMTLIEPEYQYPGMILPLISLVLLILSHRFIRKDENLVRSADRIR